jgi:hypothetical protein
MRRKGSWRFLVRDRARRSSGVETNKANDRADGKRDSGATSEIAAHVSAKCQAADSQSDESRGLLTRMVPVEFHEHDCSFLASVISSVEMGNGT